MKRWMIPLCLLFASCGRSPTPPEPNAPSGEPGEAPPPAPKATDASIPGWLLRVAHGEGSIDDHRDAAAAAVRTNEAFAVRADEGDRATLSGLVRIEQPGTYRFTLDTDGAGPRLDVYDTGGLALAGVTERTADLRLEEGQVFVEASATPIDGRDTVLRILWERDGTDGFVAEPIPTAVVTVPRHGRAGAARAIDDRLGRLLISELGCVSCHETSSMDGLLHRPAPDLREIASRASSDWIDRWLDDPHGLKEGAAMPDLHLDEPTRASIGAWLSTLGESPPEAGALDRDPVVGRTLYHTVGCVGCHEAYASEGAVFGRETLTDDAPNHVPPVPLGDLSGKWHVEALASFLRRPHDARPAGRMPSMNLTEGESLDIAAYLASVQGEPDPTPPETDTGLIEQGRLDFIATGCVNCHTMDGMEPTLRSMPLDDLTGAAWTARDESHPAYDLSSMDEALVAQALDALGTRRASAMDRLELTASAFGCRNCHVWHGYGGPDAIRSAYFEADGAADLGDEGRFPPRLDHVGWKLRTSWLEQVVREGARARPYMRTRMPAFGDAVGDLPHIMALGDGVHPGDGTDGPEPTPERIGAGRTLVGTSGMNCISCHSFADLPNVGTPGPDIVDFADRLRYDWWRTYIRHPQRQKPGTRMTNFYALGTGMVTSVEDGDPQRQTDALWAYFGRASDLPPPNGLETGGLPVHIGVEPTIFRTFLADAGLRAIAIGFPSGTHFAYDPAIGRLVSAWEGDFVDATGAWKNRGGSITGGRGPTIWTAPEGPSLVVGDEPVEWPSQPEDFAFEGYDRDEKGTPRMHMTIGGARVIEQVRPATGHAFVRRIEVESGRPFSIRRGPDTRVLVIDGGTHVETDGRIRVTPDAPRVVIELEVTP